MNVAAAVDIIPHDVASRVDPARVRLNGSRYIECGERGRRSILPTMLSILPKAGGST